MILQLCPLSLFRASCMHGYTCFHASLHGIYALARCFSPSFRTPGKSVELARLCMARLHSRGHLIRGLFCRERVLIIKTPMFDGSSTFLVSGFTSIICSVLYGLRNLVFRFIRTCVVGRSTGNEGSGLKVTVNARKLENGLRTNRAGIPYTLLLRTEAIWFPTFELLL